MPPETTEPRKPLILHFINEYGNPNEDRHHSQRIEHIEQQHFDQCDDGSLAEHVFEGNIQIHLQK